MRHWLLILMIALLPLRGWAAGGMAMQMAAKKMVTQQAAAHAIDATEIIANYSINTETSGHFHHQDGVEAVPQAQPDCPGHVGLATNGNAPLESTGHSGDCASACGVCQVCHSVALASEWPLAMESAPAHSVVGISGQTFTSADRALHLKPPIS